MLQTQQETVSPVEMEHSLPALDKNRAFGSFYRPELDLLRFFAFLLVFLHHVLPNSADDYAGYLSPGAARLMAAFACLCGYGLCLFFALSAYLIAELLLREKRRTRTIRVQSFYIRRILRIWPLYTIALLIGAAYALLRGSHEDLWRMLSYLLMMGNWFSVLHGWSANCMTPLWSISVEEQFYLLWPPLMKWLGKTGLFICCGTGIVVANAFLFLLGQRHANVYSVVWANSFVQFEMFAVGALLAIILRGKTARAGTLMRVFIAALAGCAWFVSVYNCKAFGTGVAISGSELMAGYVLTAAGCGGFLYAVLGWNVDPGGLLVYLGKISYGLYVFHLLGLLCAKLLLQKIQLPQFGGASRALLGLAFTVAFAFFSYQFIELPFLKIKSRFAT
jgi:peptidoglycan/LPS O-acetylase OafA/YrhL